MGSLVKLISVGLLDRQIEIQRPTESRSASGAQTKTWQTIETVWAARDYGVPQEMTGDKNYQELASNIINWTVRKSYSYNIRSTWRILYDGDIYQIEGPPMELGRRYIKIKTLLIDKAI